MQIGYLRSESSTWVSGQVLWIKRVRFIMKRTGGREGGEEMAGIR